MESAAGPHSLAVDMPGQETFDQQIALRAGLNALDLQKSPEFALFRLRSAIRTGAIVGQGERGSFTSRSHSQASSLPRRRP